MFGCAFQNCLLQLRIYPSYPKHTHKHTPEIKQKTHNTHCLQPLLRLQPLPAPIRRPLPAPPTSTSSGDLQLCRRPPAVPATFTSSPAPVIRLFSSSGKVCGFLCLGSFKLCLSNSILITIHPFIEDKLLVMEQICL